MYAVSIRDNPSLATKPVAVGGMGMISAANYVARQYGVRSAMPGFIAVKLCPDLVFVHHDFEKYKQVSNEVHQVEMSTFFSKKEKKRMRR